MKDLFYSNSEGLLFYVAGYTDNSSNVVEMLKMLSLGAKKLARLISVDKKNIRTLFVDISRRYKNMRVFYVKTEIVPKEAFRFGKDWTMMKWLEN